VICLGFLGGLVKGQQLPDRNSTLEKEGYELVWSEEFIDDGAPDTSKWGFEKGFVRNHELQWYQEENAVVRDGKLIISGIRERRTSPIFDPSHPDWRYQREFIGYTSSSLHTGGKFEFQFGWMEVRAKIDTAMGMWLAIWTLGVDRGWPANGEIDIMEYYLSNGIPTILANAAWAHARERAAWDEVKIPLSDITLGDADWVKHIPIWEMDCTSSYIRIYLDGRLLNEVDLSRTINPDGFNPFHQPHYPLLNHAIGSNGGDPSGTDFPGTFEVDYVRVYKAVPSSK
jgi:beta-glucanase (GH16 family)